MVMKFLILRKLFLKTFFLDIDFKFKCFLKKKVKTIIKKLEETNINLENNKKITKNETVYQIGLCI